MNMNKQIMIEKLKNLSKTILGQDKEELTGTDAYQKTAYSRILTHEEMKEEIIGELRQKIKEDIKCKTFLNITTYSGYREKLVLPEVAEYFKERAFNVDLLNTDGYEKVNVLIINWQNLETFV